jgi:hypothetical protein
VSLNNINQVKSIFAISLTTSNNLTLVESKNAFN